jgi:RNA polymerase sigma factor (sigma-70 family)
MPEHEGPDRGRRDYRQLATFDLIEFAREGDDRAREQVFQRYLPRLESWISGRIPARAMGMLDTHDIVQDVLTRASQKLEEFQNRGEGAFLAYLRTAARNRLRDEYRRRDQGIDELRESLADAGPTPLDDLLGVDARDRYEAALDRLSEDYREAVIAYVEFGYGLEELVAVLGKPSYDAARMTLRRALARLAEEMTA